MCFRPTHCIAAKRTLNWATPSTLIFSAQCGSNAPNGILSQPATFSEQHAHTSLRSKNYVHFKQAEQSWRTKIPSVTSTTSGTPRTSPPTPSANSSTAPTSSARDQRITNTGGGNTSAKITETDPLTGKSTEVMWVKGSGGDLRTSKKENFASLYMDKLVSLQLPYIAHPKRGVKAEIEDQQVNNYRHCTFNLNPAVSSIDTPLHAFIPAKQIDHTHPNAAIAIAATRRSKELVKEVLGEEIGWVPWMRPGFELGLLMQEEVKKNPKLKGLLMSQHGLINWDDDGRACYELTLTLIEKASQYIEAHDKGEKTFGGQKYQPLDPAKRDDILVDILPTLRGQVSQKNRMIGTIQSDPTILRFVNSNDAPRLAELGTSCPDHFLRTKIKPLYVAWDPQKEDTAALKTKLTEGLAKYRADYAAYYNACKRPGSPAMRDPNPTVILIPGIGMVAWGKTKSESRVTAEFYNCAVEVMRGAEAMDEYIALPQQEAFDIEYWALEEAKLQRMPAEKELARRVVVVIGAGNGIGKSVALRVAKEGAHVVSADMAADAANATAADLTKIYGQGIGVAGTGISGCGPAIGARRRHHQTPLHPRTLPPGHPRLRRHRPPRRHRRRLHRARQNRPRHR